MQLKTSCIRQLQNGKFLVVFAPLEDDMGQSSYTMSKYPSGMSIIELLDLKKELRILCRSKIRSFKVDENILSNKFLGIKYNS
jgi:hypothetical protein